MSRYQAPFMPGGATPIDAQLARRLLNEALAAGGEYADLFFEYHATGSLLLEEGVVKNAARGVDLGLGVRVLCGEATGYAYTESLTEEAMRQAAKTAAQIAASGQPLRAPVPQAVRTPSRYPLAQPSLERPTEDKRALLLRADAAARAYDPRIQRVQVSLAESFKQVLIATSDGRLVADTQPMMRFGVHLVAEQAGLRQGGSSGGGGRVGLDYFLVDGQTPEDHGREAARVAIAMLDAREAPAGELPVVLAAGDSGILLHEAVGHGLEADFNRKKTSNYAGRMGEQVASELVTVVDDPSYAHGRGSINVDDEGCPAEASTLIEGGTLRAYLQDRQSGAHFGVDSHNGRRQSFRSPPLPRMTNTVLMGGPHGPDELLAGIQRGVLAKRFSGGQVNISNGDFVFSLTESYLIEDGKVTAPLKGVNLIGNGPEVLSRVDRLGGDVQLSDGIWTCGKDGQSVPVGVGCPSLRIAAITVGGTST